MSITPKTSLDPSTFINQPQQIRPKRMTLKKDDGTKLLDVKVSVWTRPESKMGGLFFDIVTSLTEKLVGGWWRKESSGNTHVWVNIKSEAHSKELDTISKKIADYDQKNTDAKIKEVFETNIEEIRDVLRGKSEQFGTADKNKLLISKAQDGKIQVLTGRGKLGEGGFKTVDKVEDIVNGGVFALARTYSSDYDTRSEIKYRISMTKKEAEVCKFLQKIGDGIIKIHSVKSQTGLISILMEYCGGGTVYTLWSGKSQNGESLSAQAEKTKLLTEEGKSRLKDSLTKIYSAGKDIAQMHKLGYVHGDVTPVNIMLTEKGETRLIDFGLTTKIGDSKKEGCKSYLPPELVFAKPNDKTIADPKQDAWGLGMILLECATDITLLDVIKEYNSDAMSNELENFDWDPYGPDELIEAIKGLLQVDPEKRLSIEKALQILEKAITALEPKTL